MGVFKQLTSQDIIISPLEVSKPYTASIVPIFSSSGGYSYISYATGRYSESLDRIDAYGFENNIERYVGQKDYFDKNTVGTGIYSKFNPVTIYNSAKQLYYANYVSGSINSEGFAVQGAASEPEFRPDGVVTGSKYSTTWDNFRQTDLLEDKYFPTESNSQIGILSLPTSLFGDNVKPGSFKFEIGAYSSSAAATLTDDGEGRLYSGSTVVGNLVYTHGIAVITTPPGGVGRIGYSFQDYSVEGFGARTGSNDFFEGFASGSDMKVSFSSSYTLFETQYKCTVGADEMNYTQNGTIYKCGERGVPLDYITGSYFRPYITTVGLYNNAYELLAVAKLAKPLPKSNFSDTTILVNFDRQ